MITHLPDELLSAESVDVTEGRFTPNAPEDPFDLAALAVVSAVGREREEKANAGAAAAASPGAKWGMATRRRVAQGGDAEKPGAKGKADPRWPDQSRRGARLACRASAGRAPCR